MQNVESSNCSVGFLHFFSVSGTTPTTKIVRFEHINITDSTFATRNDLITFGPMYTAQDVDIHMNDVHFKNLNFKKLANIIHLKQQTLDPFVFENSSFTNVIGGHILIEPLTVSTDSLTTVLAMKNVTAANNDFSDSTFIVLKEHCELRITTCNLYRNSATFRGSIISIIDNNSFVNITNCNFNNNNGMIGGLFYVNGKSPIYVYDSTFFNNFAISAPISYTTNQGSIHYVDCNFTYNHALSVGLFDIIDSTFESTLEHSEITDNQIIDKSVTISELEDRTHCVHLCFASDSYFTYLNENRNLLDVVVCSDCNNF